MSECIAIVVLFFGEACTNHHLFSLLKGEQHSKRRSKICVDIGPDVQKLIKSGLSQGTTELAMSSKSPTLFTIIYCQSLPQRVLQFVAFGVDHRSKFKALPSPPALRRLASAHSKDRLQLSHIPLPFTLIAHARAFAHDIDHQTGSESPHILRGDCSEGEQQAELLRILILVHCDPCNAWASQNGEYPYAKLVPFWGWGLEIGFSASH
ncbi:hypothetical protein DFH07DRAFT_767640 [Mycena maculata]|uniref:Uncharacterized protein n=1 Tax=Mycena maculata TaxID=230809 RepID=A0AAD7NSS9_9AGAR|nr:hypothetical protein DFH07DRAFT_767640 [Mycena maculata]